MPAPGALFLVPLSAAVELPTVDQPLRTGQRSPGDAAVVVGLEDYLELPDVPYAERDARAVHDFLVYTRGIPSDRVTLLTGRPSRRQVLDAVAAMGQLVAPGGTAWVYFAGHGAASPSTRQPVLLPVNTLSSAPDFDEQGMPLEELQALAGRGGAEVMVITDACFTGAGRDGTPLIEGARYVAPVDSPSPGGAAVWRAAQPNQVASPFPPVEHGAFTYFAIGALRGWADGHLSGQPDGKVTAEEAQLYVAAALQRVGINAQSPALLGNGAGARTLSTGARERGPDFDAAPARPGTAAPSTGSVVVHLDGDDTDIGVLAARAQQAADAAAKARAEAHAAEEERRRKEAAEAAERDRRAKEAAEELARREQEARERKAELERVLDAQRREKIDAAAAELLVNATRDYAKVEPLVKAPVPEGKRALQAWLDRYDDIVITVDDLQAEVTAPEARAVRAAVEKLEREERAAEEAIAAKERAAAETRARVERTRRKVDLMDRNYGVLEFKLMQTWTTGGTADFGASFSGDEEDETEEQQLTEDAWSDVNPTVAELGDVTTTVLVVDHGAGWGVLRAGYHLGFGGTDGSDQSFEGANGTLSYSPSWSWAVGLRGGLMLPYDVVAPYLDYRAGLWMAIGDARVGEATVDSSEEGEEPTTLPGATMDFAAAALAHGPCLGVEVVPAGNTLDGNFLLDAALMYNVGPWVTGWSLHLGAGWRM